MEKATDQRQRAQYKVLASFSDPKDGNRAYYAGKDLYPREGYEPAADRISYLQSDKNKLKKPVISDKPVEVSETPKQ
jgi:hypothetical protein